MRVRRWADGVLDPAADDAAAAEEPLEIRLDGAPFVTVMRTPGHDLELATGLALAEGVIASPRDVAGAVHCRDVPPSARGNVVELTLAASAPRREPTPRGTLASAACGVCGRESIADLAARCPPVQSSLRVAPELIAELPQRLRREQVGFERSGGLHAAGLFGADGRVLVVREDVGRHNAVDKVVGAALRHDLLPLTHVVLAVSGRVSFEIVQKARVAGLPIVAAVSAPTSLAVELAREGGQTLIGFVRGRGFNVYAGSERLGAR